MASKKMTEQQYRTHPGVNKSTLWEMRKSPAHYKYALEHQTEKDTPALRFGRALHTAILQPEEFKQNYVVAPDIDRRTKAGREEWERFLDVNRGKDVLSQDDYDTINGMYESVWNDDTAADLLNGCLTETPLFWTDEATRIRCKCRLDAHKDGIVVDLKSCADAATSRFARDAMKYGYDVQAAHYLRGYKAKYGNNAEFWFLCVEKTPPYAVNVIKASDAFVDRGTWQLIDLMDKLKECRTHRKWPGYGRNELVLPEWAMIPDDDE